jgi:peptide/nickel transport system substrate-binding protein
MSDGDESHTETRREFVKAAAGTTVLASFAGCAAQDDSGGSGDATATPVGSADETVSFEGFEVPASNVQPASELSGEQEIDELSLIVNPPKNTPNDHETSKVFAKEAAKLGLDISVETKTWPSQVETVWYGADWDMTFWQMVGRPSRLDPDEFLTQMFHPDFQSGYNYYFWEDEEYTDVVETQRRERDEETRKQKVYEAQRIINERGPSTFLMYPKKTIAWNGAKWDNIVELSGMGARNMLTFSQMEPTTDDTQLVVSGDAEIEYINPFQQSGEIDMMQNRMLWDRLVWPDENARPQPRFATELNWKDDTTLEVPIREGETFHDGTEILAEDVKFSFDVHNQFSTYYSGAVKPLASVEVVDDYRLQFNMNFHFAPFPLTGLGRIGIVPKQKWEEIIDSKMEKENPMLYQEETPTGSGPMQFESWEQGNETVLVKFEDHFDPIAYDERVTRIIPSAQTTLSQLQEGTIDLLGNYKGDKNVLQERVDASDSLEMAATTTAGFKQISYNCDKPPFHIDAFRQAMGHRFDKDLIVDQIYSGWGEKAPNTPTSTALEFWHNENLEDRAFSLQKAANTLAQAGFVWSEGDGKLYLPADKATVPDEEIQYTETPSN